MSRVSTDPRLRRRRRAVERSRRRRLAAIAIAAATAATGVGAAFLSPLLEVADVRVVGARHTRAAEVARIAGLDDRPNLLLLSTAAVEARAETLPWVRSATVERALPGTVRVRLVERRPAALVAAAGALWTVDERGRVLGRGRDRRHLPVVTGARVARPRPGARLAGEEIDHALTALRRLPARVGAALEGVVATSVERISLSLAGGTVVRYGAAESMRAKNEVVVRLLGRIRDDGIAAAYIDVRVPSAPVVMPRTARP